LRVVRGEGRGGGGGGGEGEEEGEAVLNHLMAVGEQSRPGRGGRAPVYLEHK